MDSNDRHTNIPNHNDLKETPVAMQHEPLQIEIMVVHMRSVAYATTSFAATMMNTVFNFYYVKIYLNRFHVEESWFHTAQIIFMIWNAINDPLFGYIQDNFSFSWVRTRRHSILYGAPLFAFSFLLTWFPWDTTGTNAWLSGFQLLFVLCFYDTLFTFVLLAQCALFTEMSQKQEDRMRLIRYSQIASLMASGTVYFCENMSQNLEYYQTFQFCCVLIAIISFIAMYYTGTHAHTAYDMASAEEKELILEAKRTDHGNEGIVKQTCQILKQRNFQAFVLMNFCQVYSNVFSDNFSSIICDRLIPKEMFNSSMRSIFYGSLFVVPPLAVILGGSTVTKFGYYKVVRISFVITIFTCLSLYVAGPSLWALIIYSLVIRVCGAGAFKLFNLSLSDIIDEDQVLFSRKYPLSAMVFGTNALVTKPAQSFAPMITVSLLNRHGYEKLRVSPTADRVESVDLDNTMFHLLVFTPLIIASLQLIIWSFYTIRNSHVKHRKLDDQIII